MVAGAVYKPPVVIVPTVLLPPATPSTDQLTPGLLVPVTVALNCCAWPAGRLTGFGVTLTETVWAVVTVTDAVPLDPALAVLVALIVWVPVPLPAV